MSSSGVLSVAFSFLPKRLGGGRIGGRRWEGRDVVGVGRYGLGGNIQNIAPARIEAEVARR